MCLIKGTPGMRINHRGLRNFGNSAFSYVNPPSHLPQCISSANRLSILSPNPLSNSHDPSSLCPTKSILSPNPLFISHDRYHLITPPRLGWILIPNLIPRVRESMPVKDFPSNYIGGPNFGWIKVCGGVMNDDQPP